MPDDDDRSANLPAIIEPETPEQALMMLDRASRALTDALDYQQVRHIKSAAVAVAALAREAKDATLIEKATRLRVRAERRAGQMLIESAEKHERATRQYTGRGNQISGLEMPPPPTLADIGISGVESSQWQQLARLPDDEFAGALDTVAATDGSVSTARVLSTAIASRPAMSTRRKKANPEPSEEGNDDPDDMATNEKTKRRKSAAEAARDHRLAALAEAAPASRVVSMANGLRRELDASSEPLTEHEAQAMVALGQAYQRRIEAISTEEKGA
jgi:hypothetical protein